MRVLFLNDLWDPRIGSSIRQMYQHAARLRVLGHDTYVVSAVQDAALAGECEIQGTRVLRLHSDYDARFRAWVGLDNARIRAGVARALEDWRPDVVHAHLVHSHLSYASLVAARRARAAVVFTAHDAMTFCYQKLTCFHGGPESGGALRDLQAHWQKCVPCQRLRYLPGRNAAIRRALERGAHRVTAVSEALAGAMRANGLRVDRVIHNALEPSGERPSPAEVAGFRARLGLAGAQVVAIAGRLHEQKGVVELLRTLAALAPRYPRLRLLVMGRREVYDAEFAARARALGVDGRVVVTGWLDGRDLACAYACADVFAVPSICFETFGLVGVEAMEHARPVVATCFGGCPEVVVDGETGQVVNPFDTRAFADAIARWLEDPELARRMGEAGRARALERFGIARLADEFLEEYASAVALAHPPGTG